MSLGFVTMQNLSQTISEFEQGVVITNKSQTQA